MSARVRRRHVTHITTAHRPTDNRIMKKECAALLAAGLPVELIAPLGGDDEIGGVHVRGIPLHSGRVSRLLLGPVDVWRKLRRLDPAVIHVHDPELIPLALIWRLGRGRSAVYDSHEDLPKQVMGKRYIPGHLRPMVSKAAGLLEWCAGRYLDAIVAATPRIAQNYRHGRVVLVQNFPWLESFPEPAQWSEASTGPAVYVGALTTERGVAEMINAVTGGEYKQELLLAGPATPEVLELLDRSGSLVRYMGVAAPEEIPRLLAESSVGLALFHPMPNHLESQPTKIFEYMAAGKPFIASDFESWRNLLGRFECGLFVDPMNVSEIQDAMRKLTEDPCLAHEMGMRGRSAMLERFTFETEAGTLVSLTRDLLGS